MLKNIILLTPRSEYQHALAMLLREHNPALMIHPIEQASDLAALERDVLEDSRLICFNQAVELTDELIAPIRYGSYRFYSAPVQHPALPPEDPADGSPCVSVIAESIGAHRCLVGLETFVVPPGTQASAHERMVFNRLAHLIWQMSQALASDATIDDIDRVRVH